MNSFRPAAAAALALLCGVFSVPGASARDAQKTFASPEEAASALRAAAEVHDKSAFQEMFGPGLRDLLTGDEAQDKENSRKFAAAMAQGAKPLPQDDGTVILEIGASKWPFPIPLVKAGSAWRFDTAAGKEEIINRHIGKDELHAIGICRSYAAARKQDAAVPLPKAIHGYLFKNLPRQVGSRPGGFALAAYPERWGRSGIMTFIVDQDGEVYQRDLGKGTLALVKGIDIYDPDSNWTRVADQGVGEK